MIPPTRSTFRPSHGEGIASWPRSRPHPRLSAPQPTSDSLDPATRAIAVLDFANVTRDPAVDWLATGIAETVTNDLRSLAGLRVIDRVRVVESARRHGGQMDRMAADLGIGLAIVGSFQRAGDRLRIMARAVDLHSSEVIADAKADGHTASVFDLQDRIVSEMAGALGSSGNPQGRTPRRDVEPRGVQGFYRGSRSAGGAGGLGDSSGD